MIPTPELLVLAAQSDGGEREAFQSRVRPWLMACFGEIIAGDREERNHRFLEEALELVQACGCSAHEAHQLVDYVYGRDVGEPGQEVGGVMVTLAALCLANDLDMHANGETELTRIWTKVEQIRAKQAVKPKHSPLPAALRTPAPKATAAQGLADACRPFAEAAAPIMDDSDFKLSEWSELVGRHKIGDYRNLHRALAAFRAADGEGGR